jgi:hypothetical protein
MGYVAIAVIALIVSALLGRLLNRHSQPAVFSSRTLLHPELEPSRLTGNQEQEKEDEDAKDEEVELPAAKVAKPSAFGTTVKIQQIHRVHRIPGAPNTDVSTERQVSQNGTATITRRTGRRTNKGQ